MSMIKSADAWQLVAFRVPLALLRAIDEAAREEGISRSDVVRRAAMRDLKKLPSMTDNKQLASLA
jgi:metal-responsive CopG/Arc/MetJ family transcriptional regulator